MDKAALHYFHIPTKVIHGVNAVAQVGEEAKKLEIKKALIVTDKGVRAAGLIDAVLKSLDLSHIPNVLFDAVEVDPCANTVSNGVHLLKSNSCNGVIVIGGGSPLCAGKGIALVATNGGSIIDYEGFDKYKVAPLPVIGIPTTAGSGSEVSGTFIITDEGRNYKMAIGGDACYPEVAILDPTLLINIPYWPGMNAGMDALSHAIGAYCTNKATPFTDSVAIAAIAIILKHLASAVLTNDLESKHQLLMASAMANFACGNAKLDLMHALSHPLGSYHMPHGLANGILIPYVMEFNLPVCEDKFAQMAIAIGVTAQGLTVSELANKALERIKAFFKEVGFPNRIPKDFAKATDIPDLVKQAMGRPQIKFNIRKSNEQDLAGIYEKAFEGWK